MLSIKILILIFKINHTERADIIRTLVCDICEKPFETTARNAKYCSDECRNEGAHLKRKQWENDTDYKEIQRAKKAAQRKAEREAYKREVMERYNQKNEKQEREVVERKEASLNKLKERAEQGDNLALMYLAEPNSYEYWEAYRNYELDLATEYNSTQIRHVNDISIFDEHFVEKVMLSIEEQRIIRSGFNY